MTSIHVDIQKQERLTENKRNTTLNIQAINTAKSSQVQGLIKSYTARLVQ